MSPTVEIFAHLVLSRNGRRIDLVCSQNDMTIRPRNLHAFLHLVNLVIVLGNWFYLYGLTQKMMDGIGLNIYLQAGRFKVKLPAAIYRRFICAGSFVVRRLKGWRRLMW